MLGLPGGAVGPAGQFGVMSISEVTWRILGMIAAVEKRGAIPLGSLSSYVTLSVCLRFHAATEAKAKVMASTR